MTQPTLEQFLNDVKNRRVLNNIPITEGDNSNELTPKF